MLISGPKTQFNIPGKATELFTISRANLASRATIYAAVADQILQLVAVAQRARYHVRQR